MEKFKQRLIDFARARYDMGQTRFEDYCGLAHGTISAIKAAGPSASAITKISAACPELNLNWLFRGEGEMILGESTTFPSSSSPAVQTVQIGSIQTVNIGNWDELVKLLKDKMK